MINYITRKQKGLVSLIPAGRDVVGVERRFDPITGEELDPNIVGINLEILNQQKAALEAQLNDVETLIADVLATKASENTPSE